MSSSPMLRRPMRGFATPYTSRAMMAPMAANWRSCSGVALVLAPRSSMWVCPCAAGIAEMIAARSTPGRVPSTKCAIAVSAPVLPALTHAQAVPACTRSTATRIEDCFLWRVADQLGPQLGIRTQGAHRARKVFTRLVVAAHYVDRNRQHAAPFGRREEVRGLFLVFGLGGLLEHAPAA